MVWELRSHKPRSMAKEKNKTNQKENRKGQVRKDTQREGQTLRVCQAREADTGVRYLQARKGQELPEATRIHERDLGQTRLQSFWKDPTFLTPRFQASGLVNCETVTCTYFKTPDVWYFAMAGPGHSCQTPFLPSTGWDECYKSGAPPRDRWSHHPPRTTRQWKLQTDAPFNI